MVQDTGIRQTMEVKADIIADWFLAFAKVKNHGPIDRKKLQKLLYFSQAHYLALYGTPLFEEDFEAWDQGPVIREVWVQNKSSAKDNSYEVMLTRDFDFSIFSKEKTQFLASIWNTYGSLHPNYLSAKTHQELPWIINYDKTSSKHNKVIPKQVIENYYYLAGLVTDVN